MLQEYKELKILNVVWVSGPRLTIGMVMVENKAGVRKVYVGPGAGHDEDDDIRSICEWSGKLHARSVESLFIHFKVRAPWIKAIGDREEPQEHPATSERGDEE